MMPLVVYMKKDQILTVNGVRVQVERAIRLTILDKTDIVFPNGKVSLGSEVKSKEEKKS